MSILKTLIFYAEKNDPVVIEAKRSASELSQVDFLHVDELIPYLQNAEWPEMIRTTFPFKLKERFNGALVINRVFTLADTELFDVLNAWSKNERWFHIKVQPLLNLARQLTHDVGLRGVSKCLLPLNVQWYYIQREREDISLPNFSYAMSYESPKNQLMTAPMQKSVWSLFDWKAERNISVGEQRRHRFFVESPKGTPVICYFLGKDTRGLVFPRTNIDVDEGLFAKLADLASSLFESALGEILTYVEDDGSVRFYAFSPFMRSSTGSASFSEHIKTWLGGRQATAAI